MERKLMDRCEVCKRKFPDGCCAPLLGGVLYRVICGVCALMASLSVRRFRVRKPKQHTNGRHDI